MKLIGLQVAYFFSNHVATSWEAQSLSLKGALSKEFVEPQTIVLPIPDSMPDDVPRLMLQSPTTGYRLTASRGRVDIFFDPKDLDAEVESQILAFQKGALKALDALLPVGNILSRIGCVAKLFIPTKEPVSKLSTLLQVVPNGLSEVSIRLNTQRVVSGQLSNDISAVTAGGVTVNDEDIVGVIVDRDTNNVAGHPVIYTRVSAEEYVSSCFRDLRSELVRQIEGAAND